MTVTENTAWQEKLRASVLLPKTHFPMRADLPNREELILARWDRMDLYRRQREMAQGRKIFVLHDGPPYANGHLHIGHALNKILKDIVNRSRQAMGYDANYVPGWDCHGLPIEWKVEEQYRSTGRDKDQVPVIDFRRECRSFAEYWIDIQKTEFRRLGVIGAWQDPYLTMKYDSEAEIAKEIIKFARNGALYRGVRPILWSVVERTALADAETEYHDVVSTTVDAMFPVITSPCTALQGAGIVIWTTTPWTLSGNRAIAYAADTRYSVIEVVSLGDKASLAVGSRLVLATALLDSLQKRAKITEINVITEITGDALAGTICAHPLRDIGYDRDIPLHAADFVTDSDGSGFVHVAPGHGHDDYLFGRQHELDIDCVVGPDGRLAETLPGGMAGGVVYDDNGKEGDANARVIQALTEAGRLVARSKLRHAYPHSWRSKAPLLNRTTLQWFISMEKTGLRDTALQAIDATRFYPAESQIRLRDMVRLRPDWCVSRQRAWGVPITIFVDKQSGALLQDEAVDAKIVAAFCTEGADCWFEDGAKQRFLSPNHDPERYEQIQDILDVWFESGSTHAFVLDKRSDLTWPASLYLEGSDQHRGFFHSSLLASCGTRGRAPYDAVLTHGFVMAEDGRKMSKSLGNITAPQKVIHKFGADILRLWVVVSDYSEDLRIGPELLKQMTDIYRRLRYTLRYLLGNLNGFTEQDRRPCDELPELERWVMHRIDEVGRAVQTNLTEYDFHAVYRHIYDFCANDLSAFYFDLRKDILYCDNIESLRRRSVCTVLDHLFEHLTGWLGPILSFTAEEAWLARQAQGEADFLASTEGASLHLLTMPPSLGTWFDAKLGERWSRLRQLRRVATKALEEARAARLIQSSLEAEMVIYLQPDEIPIFADIDFAELTITSGVELRPLPAPQDGAYYDEAARVAVAVRSASGQKCPRCWVYHSRLRDSGLCVRCDEAFAAFGCGQ